LTRPKGLEKEKIGKDLGMIEPGGSNKYGPNGPYKTNAKNHNNYSSNNIRDLKMIEPESSKDINRPKGLENKEDIGYMGVIEPICSKGYGPDGPYKLRTRDEESQSPISNCRTIKI